jgi:hypothetical protein
MTTRYSLWHERSTQCHAVIRRGTRLLHHWPQRGESSTDGSGSQLGRHFLTEEAYGMVEAIWADQATYVRLHEHS